MRKKKSKGLTPVQIMGKEIADRTEELIDAASVISDKFTKFKMMSDYEKLDIQMKTAEFLLKIMDGARL